MQNTERAPHRDPDDLRTSLLYPLMLIAAIAVIVFSIVGIASLTGVMPRSLSDSHGAAPDGGSPPAARSETRRKATPAAREHSSGVVKSIRPVQTRIAAPAIRPKSSMPGAEAAVGGARSTLLAGAAYAGQELINPNVTYMVRVRMDDGQLRTFYEASQPGYGVGQKVLVTEQSIVAKG
jgi:hypothetical protein